MSASNSMTDVVTSAEAPAPQRPKPPQPREQRRTPPARPAAPARAAAESPHCAVTVHEGREAFVALEREWNRAVSEGPRDEPFFRHEYQRAWLDAFATSAKPISLTVKSAGRTRLAAAFVPRQEKLLGVPLNVLALPAGDHSNRAGFALGAGDLAASFAALWKQLKDAPWDALVLRDLPDGAPELKALRALAAADGFATGVWTSVRSPYLKVARFAGAADVEAKLDAHFRQNLRRRRRKLATHGDVAFERFELASGPAGLDAALAEGMRLEASGWKGRAGTAIAASPETVAFYSAVARWALKEKALALSFLKVGADRVGFHFGLEWKGVYSVPKCGYDEAYADCSPGQLHLREVLADCARRGLDELDFLGPSMPWKRDWTDAERPHRWLYVFRPTRGLRALCEAKFTALPLLKRFAARGV